MRVLIAPDSFKGSASAAEVAHAIATGWRSARPDANDELTLTPLADGGEGTLEALEHAIDETHRHRVTGVTGPDGVAVDAAWLELPGKTAVVELALSSGLPLMHSLDAMGATTRGLGEVILAALNTGMEHVWIALGGSASTDGGLGALRALGARALAEDGTEVPDGGGGLAALATLDLADMVPVPGTVTLLTDVTSPLLGPDGAAAVFAPQKGASAAEVGLLDMALSRFADALSETRGTTLDAATPGTGAAGGTAYGFAAAYRGRIQPGAHQLASLVGLDDQIRDCDLVITGEGAFDEQSVRGKLVGSVLQSAQSAGTPSAVVAGVVRADPGVTALSLTDIAGDSATAIADPLVYLQEAGRRLAQHTRASSATKGDAT